MPITRKLVAQSQEENQILKADANSRYIVNEEENWQFLFGPNSVLTNSNQVIKVAAELDPVDLDSIRFVAYLYDSTRNSIDNAATCTFNIYLVTSPNWVETLITSFPGVEQPNNYFFADVSNSFLSPANLDGESTLMIEAIVTRLSATYRERVYINHLGIYDSFIRLKKQVDFLDLTKLDE